MVRQPLNQFFLNVFLDAFENPGQVIIPNMGKDCTITLTENEMGQILDGLIIRAESWERTAEFLRTGSMPEDEIFVIEDCSEPTEADAVAGQYRLIIGKMKSQMGEME